MAPLPPTASPRPMAPLPSVVSCTAPPDQALLLLHLCARGLAMPTRMMEHLHLQGCHRRTMVAHRRRMERPCSLRRSRAGASLAGIRTGATLTGSRRQDPTDSRPQGSGARPRQVCWPAMTQAALGRSSGM
jgi:hypothetical protein